MSIPLTEQNQIALYFYKIIVTKGSFTILLRVVY